MNERSGAVGEALLYHDPGSFGYVSLMRGGRQETIRLAALPAALANLRHGEEVLLQQSESREFNRRLVGITRTGLAFADLDTHKTPYGAYTPDQQVRALLHHCQDVGIPAPSVVNFSGRGLHAKYIFDKPIPAAGLARWNPLQKAIGDRLRQFGADACARDATRCLRAVGTVNSRSGQECRVVWQDERSGEVARWPFEELCREFLPFERKELQARRQEREAARLVRRDEEVRSRPRWWSPEDLWCHRLADMRKVIEIRGWQYGIPRGDRNNWLYIGACAVLWGLAPAVENMEAEVIELARQWTPDYRESEVRNTTNTAIGMARQGKPYKFTTETIIECLAIGVEERRHLRTLATRDELHERHLAKNRERNRKSCDRETYEASAAERREAAARLRGEGLTTHQVADRIGCTDLAVKGLLRRATHPTGGRT